MKTFNPSAVSGRQELQPSGGHNVFSFHGNSLKGQEKVSTSSIVKLVKYSLKHCKVN